VLSWEDINIMINLPMLQPGMMTESTARGVRYQSILQFLTNLMPCVVKTTSTLAINGALSAKIPIGIRDLQSVKFSLIKTKNIREMTVESPYFPRQILRHEGDVSDPKATRKQSNFYFLVPHESDPLFIDRVNHLSIELAKKNHPTANIVTTAGLLAAMKNNTIPISRADREIYPLYKHYDVQNNAFACCVGRKPGFNVKALHMERWMLFSTDNYVHLPILLESHYMRIDRLVTAGAATTFFNAAIPTVTPLMDKHLSPAKPSAASSKKSKKAEDSTDFL